MKKKLFILALLILLVLIPLNKYADTDYLTTKCKVVKDIATENIEQEDITMQVQKIKVRILDGEYKTEEYEMNYIISENINEDNAKNTKLNEDDTIVVKLKEVDGVIEDIEFLETVKTNYYIYILISFIALILLIGRKKALKPILIISLIILTIYFVFINNLKLGKNIIITSLITELIILIFTAIILNGINNKMIINIGSSVVSIALSGILMSVLFKVMKISVEIVDFKLNINEVISLAAMISCTELSLTISTIISSYLEEIKQNNQNIRIFDLIKQGLNKGIETYTNIIGIPVIMYVCGISTIITLISSNGINNDNIALAIAYLFSVLAGAIFTIPITSLIYSLVNKNKIFYKTKSDNVIKGQRSLKL